MIFSRCYYKSSILSANFNTNLLMMNEWFILCDFHFYKKQSLRKTPTQLYVKLKDLYQYSLKGNTWKNMNMSRNNCYCSVLLLEFVIIYCLSIIISDIIVFVWSRNGANRTKAFVKGKSWHQIDDFVGGTTCLSSNCLYKYIKTCVRDEI